jgi:hypothetical protein
MTWVCKKHGENCKSYCNSILDALNKGNIMPRDLELIKWESKLEN